MRLLLFVAAFASASVLKAGDAAPPTWTGIARKIETAVPELIEKHKTPGVSVTLVDDRKIVWAKGFGVRNAQTADPVDTDTIFEACSMSKPLFAYAVLKLVENGQLDLDRPLATYLKKPYLPEQPLHEKITARMVLAHTTGFPNWRAGGWRSDNPLVVKFEPGTRFGYSGEGFLFLQRVVEHIVKEPLEPWIQRSLLKPLAMNSSSYSWKPEFEKLAAAGHADDGQVKPDRSLYTRENAAYSLYTTPSDYSRFLIEMLTAKGDSPHSLRSETVDQMLTRQPIIDAKDNEARGLGWVLSTDEKVSSAHHGGSNGTGFRCFSRFDRSTGSGVVIMTNSVNGARVWAGVLEAMK